MFISAYIKTLRRFTPLGLGVLAGSAIAQWRMHHGDVSRLLYGLPIQLAALLVMALLLTPIEYHKMKRRQA